MYLLQRPASRKYIPEALGASKIPAPIQEERCRELTAKLRSGGIKKDERDELYLGHVALGVSIASKYASVSYCPEDDLVSEAMLAIAKAVNDAPKILRDDNFTWYCTARIHGELSNLWAKHAKKQPPHEKQPLKSDDGKQRAERLFQDLLAITQDEIEERIIRSRAEGYSDIEIATQIGLSRQRVQQLRQRIWKRFHASVRSSGAIK